MKIEKIRKEMSREDFVKKLEENEFGYEGDYSCPHDIKLPDLSDQEYKDNTETCKKCWMQAIKNVKFKGEEVENKPEKYECIEDFKMNDRTIAFTKGKTYEAVNSDDGYVSFTKNDRGEKCHWVTKESLKKYFKKIEELQINQELWNEFLDGKVAVNCQTYKEAEEFLKYCKKQELNWCDGEKIELDNTEWFHHKSDTCYSLTPKLEYSTKDYYKKEEYKIITYQQLINQAKEKCTLGEEKKEYTIQEVFEFPEGTEFKCGNTKLVIKIKGTSNSKVLVVKESGKACLLSDPWLKSKFILVEKEYMTFDEAVKTGKNFKYRTWGTYFSLIDIIFELKDIDEDRLEEMLKEKSWEVEN